MPATQFHCPMCDAALRGPQLMAPGTRVRCGKCGAAFRYRAGKDGRAPADAVTAVRKPRPAPRDEDDGEGETLPRRRRPAEDDEAPDGRTPRRQGKTARKTKSKGPDRRLVVGLAIGGGAGLLLIGVLVAALCLMTTHKDAAPPVAALPVSATVPPPAPPKEGPPAAPPANPAPPADPVPPVNVAPAPAPAAVGNGALAPDVLEKVKKATVYIRVTSARGVASGSGFFEATSGEVLTNAHVIGMLHDDEPPPQHIEVVLQSGEKEEKTLPGRIIAVDRVSDLAVLDVDLRAAGLAAPPASLTVSPAGGLRETQEVYVFGFPFGENLGKNITVSTSSVSSLRKDKDGILSQVQVNGGMNPGNSGGPVVDAAGNVVGVAVAIIRNTQINFAIPGDAVRTVFNGRCSGISVGEAVRQGDKLAVSVDLYFIDPMRRISKVAVDSWAGDPGVAVPPSATPPAAPAPQARQTTPVPLPADHGSGHVELLLSGLPPPGQVLWLQPMLVDGAGETRWLAGKPVTLAAPIDAKPANLVLRPQPGKLRLNLNSKATMQARSSDGEKHSLVSHIDSKLMEDTRLVDPRGQATLYDTIEHFEIGIGIDGQGPPPSPRMHRIVQDVGKLGLALTVDVHGNVTQKRSDLQRVPAASREALDGMGDQMLQSLGVAAVPLPGGVAQPGQTWTASRDVPIDTIDSYATASADLTYTYRGVRMQNGQEVAVIAMTGAVRPIKGSIANLEGRIHGEAVVDLTAGRIVQVHTTVDVTVDIVFRDESLRSSGKLEVNLTRGPP